MTSTSLVRLSLCAGLITAASTLTGCFGPGGSHISDNHFLQESTSHLPTTVSVVDTRTGQTLWSFDIPVDKALDYRFIKDEGDKAKGMPDLLRWVLIDRVNSEYYGFGGTYPDANAIAVPADPYKKVELKFRPAPELPSELNNPIPTAPPELVPPLSPPTPNAPTETPAEMPKGN
jgi:hypothetical protein